MNLVNITHQNIPLTSLIQEEATPNDKVEGKSFSSNTTKLLKHLDKLQRIQEGKSC